MSIQHLANLKELFGFWSCLAFVAGFAGACACYISSRRRDSRSQIRTRAKLSGTLAAGMFLFSVVVFLYVLPASMAYSGPFAPEIRVVSRYDKYFAPLVALAFSVVFAFDSLRLRLRAK
jgi:hypothetical protein